MKSLKLAICFMSCLSAGKKFVSFDSTFFNIYIKRICYSFINYNSLLNIYSLVAAIRCYVGSGDIGVVNYLPQECTGPLDNACLKKTTTEKTTRSCGTALVDLCVRDTCVCISNLCNSGMPMISSKTTQLAFLLLNLTVAVFFRRMI